MSEPTKLATDDGRAVALSFMKRASRDTFRLCATYAETLAASVESGELPMDDSTTDIGHVTVSAGDDVQFIGVSGVTDMSEPRKPPSRHPSTQIPEDIVREYAYRLYLRRLEPSLTPEKSWATTRTDANGKVIASDAMRRKNSESYLPLLRDTLLVLVDMGVVTVPTKNAAP